MATAEWFRTPQNRALLAICARKTIKTIGIAGLIWGLVNVGIGIPAVQANPINACIIVLGGLMIGGAIFALIRPVLTALLIEATVCLLLFLWNAFVAVLNMLEGFPPHVGSIIIVLAATIYFFKQYYRLKGIREIIASISSAEIKQAKDLCTNVLKKKLKDEPLVAAAKETSFWGHGGSRIQLLADTAFFVKGKLGRAFIMPREALRQAIEKPEAKKFKLTIEHPLGKLKYVLDKKSTQKVRDWLASAPAEAAEAGEAATEPGEAQAET